MELDFNVLWNTLKTAGAPGVLVGVMVLAFVYIGEFTNVFKGGLPKRWAAVLSSALFAGVSPGNKYAAVVGAIGLVLATLSHFLIDMLADAYAKRPK